MAKRKTLYRNLRRLEKIAIGNTIITIEDNPRSYVRIKIETSEDVKFPEREICKTDENAQIL